FKNWAMMLMGTAILASQLCLFMWAPINGEGLNVAMGYFLFPLMMVFSGKLIWKEQLTKLQLLALILAVCGILNQLYHTHAFSWTTLWVVLLYPPYYLSRRMLNIPALLGLTFDLTFIAPFALRSEEHTSELQSRFDLVCRLLLEKKQKRADVRARPS